MAFKKNITVRKNYEIKVTKGDDESDDYLIISVDDDSVVLTLAESVDLYDFLDDQLENVE